METLLSILICSVENEERKKSLQKLIYELQHQINKNYAEELVEIIIDTDNMIKSVGKKRNDLIEKAKGKYVCFIDDDDFISDNYLNVILNHLNFDYDIVLIAISQILDGNITKTIIPSLYIDNVVSNNSIFKTNHFHLCPHKKSIAKLVLFDCINFSEDMIYSQKIVQYITNYFLVEEPLYLYFDNIQKSLTRNV